MEDRFGKAESHRTTEQVEDIEVGATYTKNKDAATALQSQK